MAIIGDPSIMRTEYSELRKEKVHLYPVSPLGHVLHFMSYNPKRNSMIPT